MSRPLHHFDKACRTRNVCEDGLIAVYQEADLHGPRMRFIASAGLAFIEARRLASDGAIILALWDTIGFDWLAE